MIGVDSPGLLPGDEALILSLSLVVNLLLVVFELAFLRLREKSILGYLGWTDRDLDREPAPPRLTPGDEA